MEGHKQTDDDNVVERKLQGRTLQVYLHLLRKSEPAGIREIQRDLGLSSPSVADYQIEKLIGMGLASKDCFGRVCITRKVKVKALESYVSVGRISVPRFALYALAFSSVAVLYMLFNLSSWNIYGVAIPTAAAGVLWLEAWKLLRLGLPEGAKKADNVGNIIDAKGVLSLVVPSLVALVVLAICGTFLFQYIQHSPSAQVQNYVDLFPSQQQQSKATIEETVMLTKEKVAIADQSDFGASILASSVLPLAGATVIGFIGYILVKFRCESRVLGVGQMQTFMFGTQDYPERVQ